jgi:hypothetical protein
MIPGRAHKVLSVAKAVIRLGDSYICIAREATVFVCVVSNEFKESIATTDVSKDAAWLSLFDEGFIISFTILMLSKDGIGIL